MGGKNKLPMKDLVAMFVEAGCSNVRSYIQSGNVIFDAPPDVVAQLPELIAARIARDFGYRTPVVVRTTEQLEAIIQQNPYLARGEAEERLHVLFLADMPDQSRVAALDPDRSPPDEYIVRGQDIYLHLPGGQADTKLTNAYFDSRLKTVSTARNWRTVNTLLQLMKG